MALDLVAPLIPNAQENKSPFILLEGAKTGFQAAAAFSEMRRRSESDLAHMALQERMAQEEHELQKQRLEQTAELIPSQIEANKAHAELMTSQGKAALKGATTAAQLKTLADQKKQALFDDVAKSVSELQLEDAEFQTKQPVHFGLNVQKFEKMYRFSPVPEIRAAIKQYQTIANEQKILVKSATKDENGKLVTTGQGRHVPLWRVAMNATDPATSEQTFQDLEASGHMDVIEGMRGLTETRKVTPKAGIKTAIDEAISATAPDYGPETPAAPPTKQYPIGTKGKVNGVWHVMTDKGWDPPL